MKNLFYIMIIIVSMQNIEVFAQDSNLENDTLYSVVDTAPKPCDSLLTSMQKIILRSGCICPGTAYISLIIEKDGSVSDVNLMRSAKGCWEETILKLFRNSKNWTPGLRNRKVVRTIIMYPIKVSTPVTEEDCE